MDERVDDGLAHGLSWKGRDLFPTRAALFEMASDGGVALHESERLFHEPRFYDLVSITQQRREGATQRASLSRTVIFAVAWKRGSVNACLGKESIGRAPEEKHSRHGYAILDHDLRIEQQRRPASFIVVGWYVLLPNPNEVVL
jgi:hypothetical protein